MTDPTPDLDEAPKVARPKPATAVPVQEPADPLAHTERGNYEQALADYVPINEAPEE